VEDPSVNGLPLPGRASGGAYASTPQSRGHRGIGRWTIAGAGFSVGLVLLVVGAYMSKIPVGVIGFLLMFAAAVYAFAVPHASGPTGVVNAKGKVVPRGGKTNPGGGLMHRFEQRWDRRRDEGDR